MIIHNTELTEFTLNVDYCKILTRAYLHKNVDFSVEDFSADLLTFSYHLLGDQLLPSHSNYSTSIFT